MSKLTWEPVLESNLLARSYFCSARWADRVVMHGGCSSSGGQLPLDDVILFDPRRSDGSSALEVINGGPRLSHHAGAVCGDCLVLVGGWNGRKRLREENRVKKSIQNYLGMIPIAE
jgi:hypothetical protein